MQYYYVHSQPIDNVPSADLEIGKFLHENFYRLILGENYEKNAEEIWNNIKSKYDIIYGWNIQSDFESFEDLKNYYSSIKNNMILWREEDEYIKKISTGIKNSERILDRMNFSNYQLEKWAYANMGDFTIFGRFDMTGDNEIIDLKTGKEDDSHIQQLKFYATIFYAKRYIVPKTRIIYLQSGTIKELHFNSKDMEDMLSNARDVADKINQKKFKSFMGEQCNLCPYRLLCES